MACRNDYDRIPAGRFGIGRIFSIAAVAMAFGAATPSLAVAQSPWRLELQIGQEDGPESYTFVKIGDVAVSPTGDIYVLDQGSRKVRAYDAKGRFLSEFGRQGAGPGEFMQPVRIAIDSLIHIFDGAQQRVSSFTLRGQHVRTRRLPPIEGLNPAIAYELRNGQTLGISTARLSLGQASHDFNLTVFLTDPRSNRVDTLGAHHSGATIWHAAGKTLPWGVARSDFGAGGAWAVAGDSAVAMVDGYTRKVHWYQATDARLDLRREQLLPDEPRTVTPADLRAVERRFREERKSAVGRIELLAPPMWSVATRAIFADDGTLWIRNGEGEERGRAWTTFAPAMGQQPQRLMLPERFHLYALRNGRLYGVWTTENDAQVIRVYTRVGT